MLTWDKELPEDDVTLCVIWYDHDYEFAYWCDGVKSWDCPDKLGFVEQGKVSKWAILPTSI